MRDCTDQWLMDKLPGWGEFDQFQPFRLNRLFHKGGDGEIKETEDEKAFAEVVAQKWNHYQSKYPELEQKYMDRVDNMDSGAAMGFAEGSANRHVRSAFSDARENVRHGLNTAGVNPNSGRAKTTMADMAAREGESGGENTTRAANSQKDEQVTGIENIIALGQGKSNTATAGMGGLADASADRAAQDAAEAFNESANLQDAVGKVAGAATSYGLKNAEQPPTPDMRFGIAGRQGDEDFSQLPPGQMLT